MKELNLAALIDMVPKDVSEYAHAWARQEALTWPYGTYSPNDLVLMYEKGYLMGYVAAGGGS